MLRLAPSKRFKRDLKRAVKRGKDLTKLITALDLLLSGQPLPSSHGDHPLKGGWIGWRDLHLESDWILIDRVAGERLELAATGSHSDPFDA